MNDRADNKHLLDDVLAEAASTDFREALLGETLRLARRRRHLRRVERATAMLLGLGLIAVLVQENWPKESAVSRPLTQKPEPAAYQLVRTRSLPANHVVTTQPLAAGQFVASGGTVGMVQTVAGNYHLLDDAELMALVGKRPAMLIRTGPHSEELVFANPEDEKGFLR